MKVFKNAPKFKFLRIKAEGMTSSDYPKVFLALSVTLMTILSPKSVNHQY